MNQVLHLITELDTGIAEKALLPFLTHLDRGYFCTTHRLLLQWRQKRSQEIRDLGISATAPRQLSGNHRAKAIRDLRIKIALFRKLGSFSQRRTDEYMNQR